MTYIKSFLSVFWEIVYMVFEWALDGCLFVIKSALFFIFDGILSIIEALFSSIDFGVLTSSTLCNWAGLPPQMIYLLNACGIPQCISILVAAIGIRMLINLIPAEFTRI